jgi:hypothetical protein
VSQFFGCGIRDDHTPGKNTLYPPSPAAEQPSGTLCS